MHSCVNFGGGGFVVLLIWEAGLRGGAVLQGGAPLAGVFALYAVAGDARCGAAPPARAPRPKGGVVRRDEGFVLNDAVVDFDGDFELRGGDGLALKHYSQYPNFSSL